MLIYIIYGLFILACVMLIVAVLLQPGKSDAGALFSSSVSSTAFGPRGTQTILAKITIGAAAAFMLCALALSLPALTGTRSVLQSEPGAETPAAPAPTAAPAANTNQSSNTAAPPAAQPATQEGAAQQQPAPANTNTTANAPVTSNTGNSKQDSKKTPEKK